VASVIQSRPFQYTGRSRSLMVSFSFYIRA
jgi:hypothetical protein